MRLIDADALREEWADCLGEYTGSEIMNSIDDAPTVEQPMTAREYGETLMKICASHKGRCYKCELGENKPCAIPDERTIPIVEKWAKEHPERSEE